MPINEFQIGDRVRVIKNSNERLYSVVGSTGTIIEWYEINIARVQFDYFAGVSKARVGTVFDIPRSELELVGHQKDPILQVIDKLHKRQRFYLEHKNALPSWNTPT